MQPKDQETLFAEEKIIIIRPIKVNHLFDETKFEVISTYTKSGEKLVLLREKEFEK
jgi:hypothetical protein